MTAGLGTSLRVQQFLRYRFINICVSVSVCVCDCEDPAHTSTAEQEWASSNRNTTGIHKVILQFCIPVLILEAQGS